MTASPESQGMCSQRLARVERFLQSNYIDSGRLPCAQLVVMRNGQQVHQSVLGMASLERAAPMAEDTLVRIYSMTKPLTSVAFMMLVEQGLVALDDPVHKFIPAWRDLGVYVSGQPGAFQTRRTDAPMRIVDLLRHTSGLTYGFQNRTTVDFAYRRNKADAFERTDGLQGFIDALSALPLEFSPGTAWNYSVATDVLGYLIGQISGVPFDEYLRRHILQPLGMVDTAFHVSAEQAHRFADCYQRSAAGALEPFMPHSYSAPPSAPSGGGGLVSTARDYLRFCEAMRLGGALGGALGNVRLLGPKTVALMRANHLPGGRDLSDMSISMFSEATYSGVGFGLGFAMMTDPAKTLLPVSQGEYWWGGAASTAFWIDPVEDISVVFLTQFRPSSTYPIRRELRTMINAAVVDSKVR